MLFQQVESHSLRLSRMHNSDPVLPTLWEHLHIFVGNQRPAAHAHPHSHNLLLQDTMQVCKPTHIHKPMYIFIFTTFFVDIPCATVYRYLCTDTAQKLFKSDN